MLAGLECVHAVMVFGVCGLGGRQEGVSVQNEVFVCGRLYYLL